MASGCQLTRIALAAQLLATVATDPASPRTRVAITHTQVGLVDGGTTPIIDVAAVERPANACQRVATVAFELARGRRRKVTAVHKANVFKLTDGLFLREVRKVAAAYPDVSLEELIVDAAAALLLRSPDRFDVIVTTNMFGDILSDEASESAGGLGLGGSINLGDDICVAQAQHGSAPDIAGRDVTNPTSLIRSAAMMLGWRDRRDSDAGLVNAAQRIDAAVQQVLDLPASRTHDLGGQAAWPPLRRPSPKFYAHDRRGASLSARRGEVCVRLRTWPSPRRTMFYRRCRTRRGQSGARPR